MLAFANMVNLLVNKLSCGGRRRFSFLKVSLGAFDDLSFRHSTILLSPKDAKFARCDVSGRISFHHESRIGFNSGLSAKVEFTS
jgi:hypothetical protein